LSVNQTDYDVGRLGVLFVNNVLFMDALDGGIQRSDSISMLVFPHQNPAHTPYLPIVLTNDYEKKCPVLVRSNMLRPHENIPRPPHLFIIVDTWS